MKKSTKSEKSVAPQAKPAKKTLEPTAAKKTVVPKKVARPKPPEPSGAPAAAPEPETPPVISTPVAAAAEAPTTIIAQIDVGFGNQLFLRGDGPGLSWEHGVPMTCSKDDQWTYHIQGASQPVTFKFLLNDVTWSTGPDFTVAPGATVVLTPSF